MLTLSNQDGNDKHGDRGKIHEQSIKCTDNIQGSVKKEWVIAGLTCLYRVTPVNFILPMEKESQ